MPELLKNFAIDFKLLFFQAINFFVVFFVLNKFVFKPLLKVLKKRRENVAANVRLKKEIEKILKETEQTRQQIINQAKKQSFEIISEAQKKSRLDQEKILRETIEKRQEILNEAQQIIMQEKEKMKEQILKEGKQLIKLGIFKALNKLPAEEKNEIFINEALSELKLKKGEIN